MKYQFLAILFWGVAGHFHATFAQSLSPDQSRQMHFLWEKLSVSYDGIRRDSLQNVFEKSSREKQSFCLALCQRTDSIPSQLISTGLDSLEQETLLTTSKRNLPRGWNSIVLPKDAIASQHAQGSWTLIHDGQTHNLIPDEPLSVYIEENTSLTSIGLKLENNGTYFEQHLIFPTFSVNACPEPDLPPWPINDSSDPWWIGCFYEGEAVTGQALLKTSLDGIFDQPVILCEGFDPAIGGQIPIYGNGDMNWETIWNCSANPSDTFQAMPQFIDSLNSVGMDFVFLDFSDGTQSVAKSAALLEHLIQLCKGYQDSENPEPLVVVGASMGGLIGRYALRKMEMAGVDHCTRLFLSIDSPFRGAWLPMGLQHAIEFLAEVSVTASDLLDALNSPAAREMLFENPNGPNIAFAEIQALQAEWGLPQIPICNAISNGNPTIPFPSPNVPLLHASSSFLGWDYVNLWLFSAPGDSQHPNSDSNNWSIFDGQLINTDWKWGEDVILNAQGHCSSSFPAWGASPGSASAHLTLLRNALEIAGIEVDQFQDQSMFIPVHSAFDIPLQEEWDSDAISFNAISVQPLTRPIAMHVDITDHTDTIMAWIAEGKPVDIIEFEHHFGWNQPNEHWIGGCSIPASGTVSIGGPEGNGSNWPVPFHVETTPCSEAIELPQFGTIILGDTLGNGIGLFDICSGSQLILGPGSTVHIGPSSVLDIQTEAQLILNGGEVIIHPGGTLNVHENGQILVQEDSQIICNGLNGKIKLNGDLIVSDGKKLNVSPTSNQVGGSMEIEHPTAYIELGLESELTLDGLASAPLNFVLKSNSRLSTNGAGLLDMHHVQIDLNEFSILEFNSKCEFQNVNLQGNNNASQCTFSNRLKWNSGTIHNATVSHQHQSSAAMQLFDLQVFNTEWSAILSGLHMDDCAWNQSTMSLDRGPMHSWIRNSTFDSGAPGKPQLEVTASEHAIRVESSVFSNHILGIRLQEQKAHLLCNVIENLSDGIQLDSLGKLDMAPPYGKNHFLHNNRHIRFSGGLWMDLLQGGNEFAQADYRYFEGTIIGLESNENGAILIACNGNDWSHCEGNGPCMINPIALELSNDGTLVLLKDSNPLLLNCEDSFTGGVLPDQDNPKTVVREPIGDDMPWTVYPNPVENDLNVYWISNEPYPEQVNLYAFNSAGHLVLSRSESPDTDGKITCSVGSLLKGWHSLHIAIPGGITQSIQIIVNAP